MDAKDAFNGYEEGPILFRPTYKYDVGTDDFDTSEKMRVPAWTGNVSLKTQDTIPLSLLNYPSDRILFRGQQLDLAMYSRAELYSSDHRPG
jgi:synaptojanin